VAKPDCGNIIKLEKLKKTLVLSSAFWGGGGGGGGGPIYTFS